jgi:CRP/FNR family cyclic AMP-dependent transcriptional regulator
MHLAQKDLFWGMNIDFVKKVTELAVQITCKSGDMIFDIGDTADYFYVLLKGSVTMKRHNEKWHTASKPGELFGWSALIRRERYAASAECGSDSEILKIRREPFLQLLETSPEDKSMLYEHFAKMLGDQLLEVYSSTSC